MSKTKKSKKPTEVSEFTDAQKEYLNDQATHVIDTLRSVFITQLNKSINGSTKGGKPKKKKKVYPVGWPRKNINSYLHFSKEMRKKYDKDDSIEKKDYLRKFGEEWKKLKSQGKNKKWEKISQKDKVRYIKEVKEFIEQHPEYNEKGELIEQDDTPTPTPKKKSNTAAADSDSSDDSDSDSDSDSD